MCKKIKIKSYQEATLFLFKVDTMIFMAKSLPYFRALISQLLDNFFLPKLTEIKSRMI